MLMIYIFSTFRFYVFIVVMDEVTEVRCLEGAVGRYVVVYLADDVAETAPLTLCEVEIYGRGEVTEIMYL